MKEFFLAQFLAPQPAEVVLLPLDEADGQVRHAEAAAEVRKVALDYLLLEGDARGEEQDRPVPLEGPEDRRNEKGVGLAYPGGCLREKDVAVAGVEAGPDLFGKDFLLGPVFETGEGT